MELKDFVAQTITEITRGILQAQKENSDTGIIIAPHIGANGMTSQDESKVEKPQTIHFDVSLIASSDKQDGSGSGKLSIEIASFKFGAGRDNVDLQKQTSSMSQHVSFDIPIVWPTNQVQQQSDFTHLEVKRLSRPT